MNIQYEKPLYVTELRPKNNQVVVSPKDKHSIKSVHLVEFNLLVDDDKIVTGEEYAYSAKLRYQAKEEKIAIKEFNDSEATIVLESPVFTKAPGQSLVIYDGDILIGGGIIA